MRTNLSEALASITEDEIKLALDEIQQYSPRARQEVYQVHASRIRREYDGFSRLLNIEPDDAIEVLSHGKVEGYRFAAALIVTVAENRTGKDLKNALLAVNPDDVMNLFCKIIESEPDHLIANHVASRVHFPGFCTGVSIAFGFLNDGGEHLQQMSIGLAIFFGIILELAASG